MKHYLHKFADQEAYTTAKARADFYKPAVSLIDSDMSLRYDPLSVIPEGFVDFGLPSGLLWYNKNLGAINGNTAESWYGGYYAWGEVETKDNYDWSTYKHCTSDYDPGLDKGSLTKYTDSDGKTVLEAVDDAATVTNSAWRMPTQVDFEELLAETTNSWVENYNNIEGLNGRIFTKVTGTRLAFKNITLYSELFGGEVSDETWAEMSEYTLEDINASLGGGDIRTMMFKDAEMTILAEYDIDYGFIVKQTDPSISMFIPAAGYRFASDLSDVGYHCELWSSNLRLDGPFDACILYSKPGGYIRMSSNSRCYGYSVRPVQHIS